MKRNPKCQRCILHKEAHTRCLWGQGNPNAKLMLVGEAPGGTEDRRGLPFCGEAGQVLDHILNKLSLKREDLFITNALKCRPPNNKLPGKKELAECWVACRDYYVTELNAVKPKVVVLMGNTPLKLIGGCLMVGKYEGSEIPTMDFPHYACYHPAACLRMPKHEAQIATAIYAAAKAAGLKPKPKGIKEVGVFPYEIRS